MRDAEHRSTSRRSPFVGLSREAVRLLDRLGAGGVATADPIERDMLIVSRAHGGISLGQGRFRRAAGDELLAADLAEESGEARAGFVLSEAGRAHLARRTSADGFQDQHREIVEERITHEGEIATARVNAAENPLDWLRRRRDARGEPLLDAAGYEAGQRLRRDLTMGQILPSISASWDLGGGAQGTGGRRDAAAASDATIAARQRATRAFTAVGSEFADLLIDLCGFLKPLAAIERERGWPPRAGKVVVRLALARLAEHYGLAAEASGPASRGIRMWREAAEPVG